MRLTNLKLLCIKLYSLPFRLIRFLKNLPLRAYRILQHLIHGFQWVSKKRIPNITAWWLDFLMLLADFAGVPEVYETLCDFVKWNTRPLSLTEQELASSVFGNSLQLKAIRLDERAFIGCRKRKIAYVSHFTINSWGKLNPQIFIHELVHVWQFQNLGSAYIPQALRAQLSPEGYNYGGVEALKKAFEEKGRIQDFNLEQQAEIVGDYYCIREGKRPIWGKGAKHDLSIYEYFVRQINVELVTVRK